MSPRPPLPALTGLRFVAAAMVVGYHVHAMVPSLQAVSALNFLGAGYTGVSLFFVLSGFVLAYNYLTPDVAGVRSIRDFFVARFARVYAVYAVALIIAFPIFVRDLQRKNTAILAATPAATGATTDATSSAAKSVATGACDAATDATPIAAKSLAPGAFAVGGKAASITIAAGTLTQAWIPSYACKLNCPGWSLSAEAFFYALFPLLALWLTKRTRPTLLTIAAGAWMLSCSIALLYVQRDPDGFRASTSAAVDGMWLNVLKFNPLVRLPEFVIGVAAGVIFLRNPHAMRRSAPLITFAAITALGLLFSLHQRMPYPLLHNGLLAPLYALLVFALASGTGQIAAWLSTRSLKLLGEASFALYLLHVAVLVYVMKALSVIGKSMDSTPWLIVIYLVAVQALAIVVLTRIEEPARRAIRARFASPR